MPITNKQKKQLVSLILAGLLLTVLAADRHHAERTCAMFLPAAEFNDGARTCVDGSIGCDNTYNDLGAVFAVRGDYEGITCFFDPERGVCIPICTKKDCAHMGVSGWNPTPTCNAYLGFVECDAIIGNRLYYVQSDPANFCVKNFCRANADGTNREVLYRADDAECSGYGSYENGYLIYPYYTRSGKYQKIDAGIYLLNLRTETLEQIRMPKNYNAMIYGGTIAGDSLYFLYLYNIKDISAYDYVDVVYPEGRNPRRLELWKYELATGEKTCLWSKDGNHVDGQCSLGYGLLFVEKFEDKLHLENLNTGQIYELNTTIQDWGTAYDMKLCLYDEGVLFYGNARMRIWHADTGELEILNGYKGLVRSNNTIVHCITEHWVYAYDCSLNEEIYLPREAFMNGQGSWKYIWH